MALDGYTISWTGLKKKHDALRKMLQDFMNNYHESGQGDISVKEGEKFGSDFIDFVDEPFQFYAYFVFHKYSLFASCLERMPEGSRSSSTMLFASPPTKSRKTKHEPEEATIADQYFATKIDEAKDRGLQEAKRTTIINESEVSKMTVYDKAVESLEKYLKAKNDWVAQGQPVPVHIVQAISVYNALVQKHFVDLQVDLLPRSSPASLPPPSPQHEGRDV